MIYFDNAATGFPKPPAVISAAMECAVRDCGNAGRGSHSLAMASARRIYACREAVCTYLGGVCAERVVFTLNATYAINYLLKGTLREGDHVLISDLEHNAVLRPLHALHQERGVTYDVFSTRDAADARSICADILAKRRPNTRAVICLHQSNVCSLALPIGEIGALCRRCGMLLLVDAAQSAGHLPINMKQMQIDALCVPAHKGLLGLQGCGCCLLGERLHPDTLIEGGSGYQSRALQMPDDYPERAEAGTLPTPAITSLAAGIAHLQSVGTDTVAAHARTLFCRLCDRLDSLEGYRVLCPDHHGAVLSFVRQGFSPDHIGAALAQEGICVRTGLHCAPMAHKALGTAQEGTVRVSFGLYNTPEEVDALWRSLRRMTFCHTIAPTPNA